MVKEALGFQIPYLEEKRASVPVYFNNAAARKDIIQLMLLSNSKQRAAIHHSLNTQHTIC